MRWVTRTLAPGVVEHDPGCSWHRWAEALTRDAAARTELTHRCGALTGAFWECIPTARDLAEEPFRFVIARRREMATLQPVRRPFDAHSTPTWTAPWVP